MTALEGLVNSPITYLYRCFDREGQLLYAGVADNVERRKREHAKDKFWWHDVTRITRMAFQSRTEALWAEWAVISTCNPIYNGSLCVPPVPLAIPDPDVDTDKSEEPAGQRVRQRTRTARELHLVIFAIKEAHPDLSQRQIAHLAATSDPTVRRILRRYHDPESSSPARTTGGEDFTPDEVRKRQGRN